MPKKSAVTKWFWSEELKATSTCPTCSHGPEAHDANDPDHVLCPPTPPSKAERPAVKVDEAVAKPGFVQQLEDATGVTAAAEKARNAEEHYERRVVFLAREDVPLKQLRPYAGNPREQLGDVKGLVESMERNGFLGALLVRQIGAKGEEGVYEVITGNRRLEAAKQAGLEVVPCDIYELTDVQALEMNLTEQINRAQLTPLEEAEGCRRLMEEAGYDKAQVAAKLGQSVSWVTKRVSLCGLAAETKKALAKGTLPLTVAQGIASLPTQKLQADATDTAVTLAEGGYKGEEILEKLRAEVARPLSGVPFKLTDAELVPEAGACSKCPYNSTNAQMPGLFDNAKAGATCAKTPCLDEKLMAAWKRDAKKLTDTGAKLLSLSESARIFRGTAETLDSASKYVVLNAVAPQDRTKRTWSELLRKAKVDEGVVKHPQTYVARDGKGNARLLCLAEACRKIVAERLKLKWAEEVEGEESTNSTSDADMRARSAMTEARHRVADQATVKIAKAIATSGLKLPHLKALIDERDVDEFAEAIGMDTKTRKAFDKAATTNQIAAVAWFSKVQWGWQADQWNENLLALCQSEGINLDEMLKAQLDGAKAEALMGKKGGKAA